jgi:hypothetical protein
MHTKVLLRSKLNEIEGFGESYGYPEIRPEGFTLRSHKIHRSLLGPYGFSRSKDLYVTFLSGSTSL